MVLFISKLISSVIEIIALSLIPFIWWLVTARKKEGFFNWLGIKTIDRLKVKKVLGISAVVEVSFILLSFYMLYAVKGVENLATSDFAGLGIKVLPAILIYAIFNTALPEEIFFRGFLLKRLSNKFGFGVGNFVQCVAFGLMHGLMFVKYTGLFTGIAITLFTEAIAWFMGYVNEKKADGSILPSWGIHAVANIFSGLVAALSLI